MAAPLGILAGGGPFPAAVATAAAAQGRPVYIVGLRGFVDEPSIAAWPNQVLRMGAAGDIMAALRAQHVIDLVIVGPVRRPSLLDLRPDAVGARILARIGRAAFAGDDGFLAAIVQVLGTEGFRIIGAHEILGDATAPAGVLGAVCPDDAARHDVARGVTVVRALGAVDVGQGAVVQQGIVLALEAIEGTDAMLARAGTLARPGPGGVLVKLVKPGQDRRTDLPTIGPATIAAAAAAGLRGLAFEAGGTLITDRAACIAAADAAGLFLLGIHGEPP